MSDKKSWGLAGLGRSGDFAADLDEPSDGEGPWNLQLSGPRWNLMFDVPGPETVQALLGFVNEHGSKPGFESHQIVDFLSSSVSLAKNSDLGVRFVLVVRGAGFVSSATFQDDEVAHFRKVLEGVIEDLIS